MRGILFVVFSIFFIFILNGCSQNNAKSLVEEIYNKIPESEGFHEVYHIEVIDSGFIVFYRSNNGLRAGMLNQKMDWITKAGDASLNPDEGLSVVFANKEEDLYFSYGVVTNPDIDEVISTKNNNENKAKIIQSNKGIRLWFVFYDEPTESILPNIIGLSKDGAHLVNSNE